MIKKWHHLALKKLSALLTGITSKHEGDLHCLNCFYSYSTKNLRNIKMYVRIIIVAIQKCLKKILKIYNTAMERNL